uniref:Uncharacterized protein n=1 Tax=Davidia involucrata TaxID=16924 RepID=A0A5B7CA33_DAVIN
MLQSSLGPKGQFEQEQPYGSGGGSGDGRSKDLGCTVESLPSVYPSLPLEAPSRSKAIWDPVVELFQKRLAGWRGQHLSKGGKLTLIKNTLEFANIFYVFVPHSEFSGKHAGKDPKRLPMGGWMRRKRYT